jgi:VIT1/CCC1 family predicted Fe2+/Mn2+ transporter
LAAVATAPVSLAIPVVAIASLVSLGLLGAVAARAGGADMVKGAMRVVLWGVLAMAITAGVGSVVGTVV